MKQYKINPASQRVVVLPQPKEESKTKHGIILPGTSEENKPEIGLIVEVGEGEKERPMMYKVGQLVLFSDYAGLAIHMNFVGHGENTYKVMNQADIMGRLTLISE